MSEYSEKLRDPRWQRKRLEVLQRDEWHCQICFDGESTLHVHHRYYERGKDPWDYPDRALVTLCESCHEEESKYGAEAERGLLRTLKNLGFTSTDLMALDGAFSYLNQRELSEPERSMLVWYFAELFKERETHSGRWRAVHDIYWQWIKTEVARREAEEKGRNGS